MKIFQVNSHGISFMQTKDKSWHPLRDIDEDDILAISSLIIDGEEIEMDPVPEDNNGRDPAEFIIYKELYSQFEKITNDRESILKRIDDKFAEAKTYYESDELKYDLLQPGSR